MSESVEEMSDTKSIVNEEKDSEEKEKVNDVSTPLDSVNQEHSENVHYEGDTCIYTDPVSKFQYIWNTEKNEWIPKGESEKENTLMTPGGVKLNKDYKFDGDSYIYVDKQTGITYKYDSTNNKWVERNNSESPKKKKRESVESDSEEEDDDDDDVKEKKVIRQDMSSGHYSFDGDSHLYTDPNDGTVYLWDREKNAWFPKVDEDFLALYQMNYGFTETQNSVEDKTKEIDKEEEAAALLKEQDLKRKAAVKEPTWFDMDDQHNTKVYVSNLPLDITEEEFVTMMQKCGLVMKDVDNGKMKVKLYTEPGSSQLKGDALCTYIKVESVELALKLIDGSDLRGKKLKVERAKFQMKGNYDPNLKPKKRRKKDKEKLKKLQEKLLDWRPDKMRGERSKHERVVVVKNLFEPATFEKEVALLLEYQQDLREECAKCGDVRKVVIYDRNPEGVAQITFREPEEADECVKLLNGRWFGKRKITAETWDGKTKYKILETEEEKNKRLQQWNKFLEDEKLNKANQLKQAGKCEEVSKDSEPGTLESNVKTNVEEQQNSETLATSLSEKDN